MSVNAHTFRRRLQLTGRRVLSGTMVIALALPAFAGPKDPATPEQMAFLKKRADAANHPWTVWGKEVVNQENEYVKRSGFPSFYYYQNQKVELPVVTQEMAEIAEDTQKVVEIIKPGKTGTFWESATPSATTENGKHQWHELDLSGLGDPDNIKQLLDKLKAEGITDVRFGLDTFKVDPTRPQTMEPVIKNILIPMWERGMLPIVAFDWFGNLEMLEKRTKDGKVDIDFSYMNNPKYVEHRERLADVASKAIITAKTKFNRENAAKIASGRVPAARWMANLINETHTNVAFNKNGWNGSGEKAAKYEREFFTRNDWGKMSKNGVTWGSPDLQRNYIPAVINLGRAAVRMRMAVERNLPPGDVVLYVHNEAMTPSYYPTHDKYLQFAVSRMYLGDEVFTEVDYDALMKEPLDRMIQRLNALEAERVKAGSHLNELEGMLKLFIFGAWNDTPEKKESARRMLISMLQRYQRDVAKLKSEFKITMRHRLIFGADYYMQSEFISPKSVPQLAAELSKNQGEGLKRVLDLRHDSDFVKALEEKARVAEERTGVKIWNGETSRSQIDFARLLTIEDAIMMDLLVGFRYANWAKNAHPDLAERQKRAGLDKNLDAFEKAPGDEYRADQFVGDLLKDGEKKLRYVLGVQTDAELLAELEKAARDVRDGGPVLRISANESVRDILNKDSRRILMRLFGLKNERFLGFLPPHYPVQIKAGIREGFLPIFMRYNKVMKVMHVAVKESGSPYYPWAENVHKQMALQAAMGAKLGNYIFVSYHFGPAVHTVGWSPSPLWGDLTTNNMVNESGFFKFEDKGGGKFEYSLVNWPGKGPWLKLFHDPLIATLRAAEKSQPKQVPVAKFEAGKTNQAVNRAVRVRSCRAVFIGG